MRQYLSLINIYEFLKNKIRYTLLSFSVGSVSQEMTDLQDFLTVTTNIIQGIMVVRFLKIMFHAFTKKSLYTEVTKFVFEYE